MSIFAHIMLVFIVAVLFGLAVVFFIRFCIPAATVNSSLTRVVSSLSDKRLPVTQQVSTALPSMIGAAFYEHRFASAWKEYVKTLHPKQVRDHHFATQMVRYRATALADVYFTPQTLVDSPLSTDYVKHLELGGRDTMNSLSEALRQDNAHYFTGDMS